MSELFDITLQDQIGCARREIKMRERVYPNRVAKGSMTQEFADQQISVMKAVLETLEQIDRAGKKEPADAESAVIHGP